MKQITKYVGLVGIGLALGAPITSGKVEALEKRDTRKELINQIHGEYQAKNRIKGWKVKEEDGNLTLGVENGRTSYSNIICSSNKKDLACETAINSALELIEIKKEINNEYAPNVPRDNYSALKLKDMNNDGEVDIISWPVYTYTNSSAEEIHLKNTIDTVLAKKANRALYLENIIQATIKYKLNY
jgi:hypothetical protein